LDTLNTLCACGSLYESGCACNRSDDNAKTVATVAAFSAVEWVNCGSTTAATTTGESTVCADTTVRVTCCGTGTAATTAIPSAARCTGNTVLTGIVCISSSTNCGIVGFQTTRTTCTCVVTNCVGSCDTATTGTATGTVCGVRTTSL
jgi:hypothetical protein